MINGRHYYFFRLDHYDPAVAPEYRIATSFADLLSRFGEPYLAQFCRIVRLDEVNSEHIVAINEFLFGLIS